MVLFAIILFETQKIVKLLSIRYVGLVSDAFRVRLPVSIRPVCTLCTSLYYNYHKTSVHFVDPRFFLFRHLLIQERITGYVPSIHFVKDESQSKIQLVEELLKVADMGPDFESTPLGEDMKSPPEVSFKYKLSSEQSFQEKMFHMAMKRDQTELQNLHVENTLHGAAEIKSKSSSHGETREEENVNKYSDENMKCSDDTQIQVKQNVNQNVYGLDHTDLMQKVLHAKNKRNKEKDDVTFGEPMDKLSTHSQHTMGITRKNVQKLMRMKRAKVKPPKETMLQYETIFENEENGDDERFVEEEEDYIDPDFYDEKKIT